MKAAINQKYALFLILSVFTFSSSFIIARERISAPKTPEYIMVPTDCPQVEIDANVTMKNMTAMVAEEKPCYVKVQAPFCTGNGNANCANDTKQTCDKNKDGKAQACDYHEVKGKGGAILDRYCDCQATDLDPKKPKT